MRPTICQLINNHEWNPIHKFGNKYVFECRVCRKVKTINVTERKEIKIRFKM